MVAKLHAYGVTGRLQSWLTSYLNNRTQSVKLGPVLSDSSPICSGVPQGSTLGPLLFLAFVNDLPVLNPGVSLFADDTCMLRSSPSVSRFVLDLQAGITDITSWMALWKLKPNVGKTKVMIIPPLSTTLYYPLPPLVFHFSTTPIEYVDHHRHLGVIFDTNLSWTHHVAHICKKTSQAIGIIYSHRAHLPDSCRALFYNAYILRHFDYCCTAWTNLSIAQQQKLETHNRSLLKILYHMPKSLSSVALYMLSSTRPLLERRRIMMCCLIHRIRLSKMPPHLKAFYWFRRDNSTRNQLSLPLARSSALLHSPLFNGYLHWLKLHQETKGLSTLTAFRNALLYQ